MSLLSYKRDWHNATTDAERQLANLGAESIRGSYGAISVAQTAATIISSR